MAGPGIRIAASILDADQGDLAAAVERVERAGGDRIHLDVMDAHFVPNLTWGPPTIKALRRHTSLPFDAHLMIAEPGRWLDEYLEAGCDSITLHVEVAEDIGATLGRIRAAGRAAGLAVRPRTALDAIDAYRDLLDIVMVMTVEPGFGGQRFMADVARAKLPAAASHLADPARGEVHVDGGVNPETVGVAAEAGAQVLVVGSALWRDGTDMADEIRRIRATAAAAADSRPSA
jgi:ribulose-phosphate 3-epimerase